MAITPNVWSSLTQLNPTALGSQSDPAIVSLTNGNYLVAWTESGDTIASSSGNDIVGQLYDFHGNPIGKEFRINDTFVEDNEFDVSLAALPNGGFAAVYTDGDANGNSIRVEVYDASGLRVPGSPTTIQADTNANVLRNAQIASRSDGSYLVTYEREVDTDGGAFDDEQLVARFVDSSGTVGAEFSVFGSADGLVAGGVAALSNGNFVVTFADADDNTEADFDPQFQIVTSAGVTVIGDDLDSGANFQSDVQVAALSGGGFVATWVEANIDGSGDGIRARVYNNAGVAQGAAFTVNTTVAGGQNEPAITALQDGGFVIVWDDDGSTPDQLRGQRFDAGGNKVGVEFQAGSEGSETSPVITTLSDGRFIVGFDGTEIQGTIFDPRGAAINGTAGDDKLTSRPEGAQVNGLGGNDTLQGRNSADVLDGGTGADNMAGAGGNDTYFVDNLGDVVTELAGGGTDLVQSTVSFTLGDNVENLTLLGTANISGTGNGLANIINGNAGANKLFGGGFNDQLFGLNGNDQLDGGTGLDILVGGRGRDLLKGGSARDLFDFNAINESGKTTATRDQILDFQRGTDDIDLRTIDASTSAGGNNAFKFIGTGAFTGVAGQLRIVDLGANVIVQADVNGNGTSDFEILVKGVGTLAKGDFLL